MVTINKVIELVDGVKPNTFDEEVKFYWLRDLDGMISHIVMQQEEPVRYEYPKDLDTPLLVDSPYDGIYALYLEAQIDYRHREYDDYNNAMLVFNERFEEFKKAYIREHMPKSAGQIKL